MKRQAVTFEEIYDLFAMRIIIDSENRMRKSIVLESIFDHNGLLSSESRQASRLDFYTESEWLRIIAYNCNGTIMANGLKCRSGRDGWMKLLKKVMQLIGNTKNRCRVSA